MRHILPRPFLHTTMTPPKTTKKKKKQQQQQQHEYVYDTLTIHYTTLFLPGTHYLSPSFLPSFPFRLSFLSLRFCAIASVPIHIHIHTYIYTVARLVIVVIPSLPS
ncbi:hypothetical protein H2248_010026 [Termitomyces sp. 'cryptogamus']|nr:hypothetical protein H2248_010026 [Termitomyces sp. 'cryptogamus']